MFTTAIKRIFLSLVYTGYLAVSMPIHVFLAIYKACKSGFDYNESYTCYIALISVVACHYFAEMIVYTNPMAHIYVMSAYYLLTCFLLGIALALVTNSDQSLIKTLVSIPEATAFFLQNGKSLYFKPTYTERVTTTLGGSHS